MVLAFAVIAGLIVGLVRARIGKRSYRIVSIRWPGLVIFAFIPQLVYFYLARAGIRVSGEWAPVILISSQVLLLVFVWLNRKQPGFWLLGAGLLMNFLVIVLNGGLMPISPEAVRKIYPNVPESAWSVGRRLGNGKDIVLPVSATRLWFLSDRLVTPEWLHYPVAFSVGDVLVALGAFWLLWSLGGENKSVVADTSISSQ